MAWYMHLRNLPMPRFQSSESFILLLSQVFERIFQWNWNLEKRYSIQRECLLCIFLKTLIGSFFSAGHNHLLWVPKGKLLCPQFYVRRKLGSFTMYVALVVKHTTAGISDFIYKFLQSPPADSLWWSHLVFFKRWLLVTRPDPVFRKVIVVGFTCF